jgi:predicted small integral membrane protein
MSMSFKWMYWTLPTAIFFITLFLMICGMLVWELISPTIERKGFLLIPTTRGTRFFLGLLGSAYIHLAWMAFTDLTLWIAMPISAVWMAVVMIWG